MNRAISRALVLLLALPGLPGTAAAHHPPRYERCQLLTFTGRIERMDWQNPHVRVFIRSTDGVSYEADWLSLHSLHLAGIEVDTLHVGDDVVIEAGVRSKDVTEEPILLSRISRPADGWEWSQPLQGC